ncbi:hypothetical protein [Desulfobacterium sp. N47]|uniref:Uncharacterized protein n=1 Tax=uncultured Desulfobacterium sp. TaxID=201089 RepID=E1YE20_9BACT|nr:hypothetical protein N47_B20960 [uncultured Desulfobacterium sp.]
MPFKQNLINKIRMDKMADKVLKSIVPTESGYKVDKETMRKILAMFDYQKINERDLELFAQDTVNNIKKILVLDNELALYNTTIDDVVLRKSPTLKEMLSFHNARKILNDSDVLLHKKEDSVRFFQNEYISSLDLSFNQSDILDIEKDGRISLEKDYTDGVTETLELFSELLGCTQLPHNFTISKHIVIGVPNKEQNGETRYGPIVIYSTIHNTIKLFDEKIGVYEKEKIEFLQKIAYGKEKASKEGPEVFQYLTNMVLLKNQQQL